MGMNIAPPPVLQGEALNQTAQLYRYLFQISGVLNNAMEAADSAVEAVKAEAAKTSTDAVTAVSKDLVSQYNQLKALIVKSADDVRAEMTVLETSLKSTYIAKSEWGTYEENIRNDITATATDIVESYGYDAWLESLQQDAVEFEKYRISTTGYIRRGIIGYDENNFPIIGVAIGQDLKVRTVTIDGVEYEEIDTTQNLATYTADRVTFWQNGVEAGYFSNSELVVTRIRVADKIIIGDKWEISRKNGFTLKWIGG